MAQAIYLSAGNERILIETDAEVTLPAGAEPSPGAAYTAAPGVPRGMQPVLGRASGEFLVREFSEVRALIVTCCNNLYESMAELNHPDSIALEFGIKLASEAGVPMLARASGEANFKISIEWKKG